MTLHLTSLAPSIADHPFTTDMALAAGLTRSQLRSLRLSGQLTSPLYGVYASSLLEPSTTFRAEAAALVLPPHGVVSDRSAAWLHGIDVLNFGELDVTPRLEVVSVLGHERPRRFGVHGGERDLLPEEITEIGGIRVTTPVRTACDLACLRGRYRALGTLDAFRRRFGITELDLHAMLPRFVGRRGVTQLRALIPLTRDGVDSQPESWIRLMIQDHGLPAPEAQVWVDLPDGSRRKLENAYPRLRVAAEYDGDEFHSEEEDRDADDRRRAALEDLGWCIFVIRKDGLGPRARTAWLDELDQEIARRAGTRPKRVYARDPNRVTSYRWRRR